MLTEPFAFCHAKSWHDNWVVPGSSVINRSPPGRCYYHMKNFKSNHEITRKRYFSVFSCISRLKVFAEGLTFQTIFVEIKCH